MNNRNDISGLPPLLADSTLGRLAKWLRLAGLDVRWDQGKPDAAILRQLSRDRDRWILTRSQNVFELLEPRHRVFIQSNVPAEQARQIIRHFKIERLALRPLSRCQQCNLLMHEVSKAQVAGLVPDHIWQSQDRYTSCRQCHRVYWPGTHASRIRYMIDLWFE